MLVDQCIKPFLGVIESAFLPLTNIITADMGQPLEADKELQTVGWANVLSGLTGGFTGR